MMNVKCFLRAFALCCVATLALATSCGPKPVPEEEAYVPTIGVSPCQHQVQAGTVQETLYFLFDDDEVLWLEHRGMELNCARTLVETQVRFETNRLYIREAECFGPDSVMALCTCAKNVGYRSEGVSSAADSLQVELYFSTFERGLRSRSFKIPSSGSGEVWIGEWVGL